MGKYKVIYADPPWEYKDKKSNLASMGGTPYDSMSMDSLKQLPVDELAYKDSVLLMWATMPLLPQALELIDAWGFKYTTCAFTWVKLNPCGEGVYSGLGHWVNGNAELCLLAKKGRPERRAKNVKQIQMHPVGKHSKKPDYIRHEIKRLFGDVPSIELFARNYSDGWDVWGNEVVSDIDMELETLVSQL